MKKILPLILAAFTYNTLWAMDQCIPENSNWRGWVLAEGEWIEVSSGQQNIAALNVANSLYEIVGKRKYNRLCRAWTVENMAVVAGILDTAKGPFGYNLHGLKCEVDEDSVTTYVKHLELTLNRKDFAAFTLHPYLVKAKKEKNRQSNKDKAVKKAGCKKATF